MIKELSTLGIAVRLVKLKEGLHSPHHNNYYQFFFEGITIIID